MVVKEEDERSYVHCRQSGKRTVFAWWSDENRIGFRKPRGTYLSKELDCLHLLENQCPMGATLGGAVVKENKVLPLVPYDRPT